MECRPSQARAHGVSRTAPRDSSSRTREPSCTSATTLSGMTSTPAVRAPSANARCSSVRRAPSPGRSRSCAGHRTRRRREGRRSLGTACLSGAPPADPGPQPHPASSPRRRPCPPAPDEARPRPRAYRVTWRRRRRDPQAPRRPRRRPASRTAHAGSPASTRRSTGRRKPSSSKAFSTVKAIAVTQALCTSGNAIPSTTTAT